MGRTPRFEGASGVKCRGKGVARKINAKRRAGVRAWKKSDVVACDLFAGAGGFSLGAHLAGIKVASAVEWNSHACSTYRKNLVESRLTPAKLFEADITELEPHEVSRASGFNERGCDLLLGGASVPGVFSAPYQWGRCG